MRNLLAILRAAARGRELPSQSLACHFRVMPWDVGIGPQSREKSPAILALDSLLL